MICLHRRSVFAAVGVTIAPGAMVESLLSRNDVGRFTVPDLQGRLLNGATA
jgi:hypothetical protein